LPVRQNLIRAPAYVGRLDAAFNNARVQSSIAEVADATLEEFDRVNAINLRGVWSCMKYELLQMRKQGSGAVVNNSLLGGLVGDGGSRDVSRCTTRGHRWSQVCWSANLVPWTR
jgi:NAD(P)-dependent dehydrogenase (short-subunit alcohol dehydrogenase family)